MQGATQYDPTTAETYLRSLKQAANAAETFIRAGGQGSRDNARLHLNDVEKYLRLTREELDRR